LLLTALPAAAQYIDLQVCGEFRAFSLVSTQPAEGVGEITYKWYENNIPMDNSNTASICITEGRPAGTYAYVRKASNEACPEEAASNTYTVEVVGGIVRTSGNSSQTVTQGTAITPIVFSAPNSTLALSSGSLPTGVNGSPSGASFTISGTPTAAGTYNYTVSATYSQSGCSAQATGTLIVVLPCTSCKPFTACAGISQINSAGTTLMKVNAAKSYCADVGPGWRLPYASELECLCNHKFSLSLPQTINNVYWSATITSDNVYRIRNLAEDEEWQCDPGLSNTNAVFRTLCVK
jgi:hypothetical protein